MKTISRAKHRCSVPCPLNTDVGPFKMIIGSQRGGMTPAVLFVVLLGLIATSLGVQSVTYNLLKLEGREILRDDLESLEKIVSFTLKTRTACSKNFEQNGLMGATLTTNFERPISLLYYTRPATDFSEDDVFVNVTSDKRYFKKIQITNMKLTAPKPLDFVSAPADYKGPVRLGFMAYLQVDATHRNAQLGEKKTISSQIPFYIVTNDKLEIESCYATRLIDSYTTLEDMICQAKNGDTLAQTTAYRYDPAYYQCKEVAKSPYKLSSIN